MMRCLLNILSLSALLASRPGLFFMMCDVLLPEAEHACAGIVQIGGESVCPVDASGNFTQDITDFAGQ